MRPQKVTSINIDHGLHLLEEYPPSPDDDFLDYYGVLVPEYDLYLTELDAYKALVDTLYLHIKTLTKNLEL